MGKVFPPLTDHSSGPIEDQVGLKWTGKACRGPGRPIVGLSVEKLNSKLYIGAPSSWALTFHLIGYIETNLGDHSRRENEEILN